MSAGRGRPAVRALLGSALVVLAGTSACTSACARMELASLEAYPADTRVTGPAGGYELTVPTDAWARDPSIEGEGHIDLALVRKTADAWLNVSVVADRYPTADLALEAARARADSLMLTSDRQERDVAVPGPAGDLPGREGVYCGSFDRELRSRDNCFVILAVVRDRTAYVLVGQARVHGGDDEHREELEQLIGSLRLVSGAPADVPGAGGGS